jgi:hypothetical protein
MGTSRLVFLYDIACKYRTFFLSQVCHGGIKLLPDKYSDGRFIRWLVPKFHLGSHKPECADRFSFNYAQYVGRMSGELVETPWAQFNSFQYMTREMGWGAWRDLLVDVFNHWNWDKVVGIGKGFNLGSNISHLI